MGEATLQAGDVHFYFDVATFHVVRFAVEYAHSTGHGLYVQGHGVSGFLERAWLGAELDFKLEITEPDHSTPDRLTKRQEDGVVEDLDAEWSHGRHAVVVVTDWPVQIVGSDE